MSVIAMTVFVSLALVGLFACLFLHQARGPEAGMSDRNALMPLEEDDGVAPQRPAGHGPADS